MTLQSCALYGSEKQNNEYLWTSKFLMKNNDKILNNKYWPNVKMIFVLPKETEHKIL